MTTTGSQTQDPDIREVFDAVLPEVLEIANQELGDNYLTADDFILPAGIAYYSLTGNTVTGFGFCRIADAAEFLEGHPKLGERLNPAVAATERFGLLSTVAVKDCFQGLGIGTALARTCVQWLAATDVPFALMIARKGASGIHIAKVLHKTGFTGQFEIPDYWVEDSVQRGYQCPDCGDPPCHCSAGVYMRYFRRT